MDEDDDLRMFPKQHDPEGIGENDRRVAVQITTQNASSLNTTLLLPQAILDIFSGSEKEVLPRLLKQ